MTLQEWISGDGARYAEEIRSIVSGLGYASVESFPRLRVVDGRYDDSAVTSLAKEIGKALNVPPEYSASTVWPLVPDELGEAPILFASPKLESYPLPVASQMLAFSLAFIEGCLRFSALLPLGTRRFQDLSSVDQGFSLVLQCVASSFAFDRFTLALANEGRPFDLGSFLRGFSQSWELALGLAPSRPELSKIARLCVLAQICGRAACLRKLGLEIWGKRGDGAKSPDEILDSGFGPAWRELDAFFSEIDTFDLAFSRREEFSTLVKTLIEPNNQPSTDYLEVAVSHINRAFEASQNPSLAEKGLARMISDNLNLSIDAIKEALRLGMDGAKEQLKSFEDIFKYCAILFLDEPEIVTAFERYADICQREGVL